ncbi:MAG: DUF998 domain-containing protein [Promethearchaeota archaeon]
MKLLSISQFKDEITPKWGTVKNFKPEKIAGSIGIFGQVYGIVGFYTCTLFCGPGCGEPQIYDIGWYIYTIEWASDGSFNWKTNALSNMGVSTIAGVFNTFLILFGIVNFIFALGLAKTYTQNRSFYIGNTLCLIYGLSYVVAGIFPEIYLLVHMAAAIGVFAILPIAMILIGRAFKQMNMETKGSQSFRYGIITLILTYTPWEVWVGLGFAVKEIVSIALFGGWIIWMSLPLISKE